MRNLRQKFKEFIFGKTIKGEPLMNDKPMTRTVYPSKTLRAISWKNMYKVGTQSKKKKPDDYTDGQDLQTR